MTTSRSTTRAAAGRRRRRAPLAALLVAIGLACAGAWYSAVQAGEPAGAAKKAAGEPSFDLPPIVVQVAQAGREHTATMVFKASLVFDETDEDRINDSLRIAKTLLPKIMGSVITGVQGHRFDSASKAEDVNRMILYRSVAVLQPYGVVVKTLRIERLGNR